MPYAFWETVCYGIDRGDIDWDGFAEEDDCEDGEGDEREDEAVAAV